MGEVKTILLVDDQAITAMSEAIALRKAGYRVMFAYSGQEAVTKIRAAGGAIDLILMDIDLGRGMDGTKAAQEILKEIDVPILFLSSHTEPEYVEKTEAITSYGYVVKDSGPVVLQASIKMAFKLYAAHQSIRLVNEKLAREISEHKQTETALQASTRVLNERVKELNCLLQLSTLAEQYGDHLDLICKQLVHLVPPAYQFPEVACARILINGQAFQTENFIEPLWSQACEIRAAGALAGSLEVGYLEDRPEADEGPFLKEERLLLRAIAERLGRMIERILSEAERKQAEGELKHKTNEIEKFFSSSLDFLCITDSNGRILRVNQEWARVFGYSLEELMGRSLLEFVHPDDYELTQAGISDLNAQKPILNLINRYRTRDGAYRWVEWRAVPDGPIAYASARDITEHKRMQDMLATERRRLEAILQGTHVGSWEWFVQTGETIFNERWAEIIGYTLEELAPISIETWEKYTHPDDLKRSGEQLEKHFQGELAYYEVEARMRHKQGHWIWVLDRGRVSSWTEDGRPLLMSGTHQDITERKQVEEVMQQMLHEKEVLVRELQHRVKNSLSLASGIVALGGDDLPDERTRHIFADTQSRLQSMASVYDHLYQGGGGIDRINLLFYINSLVSALAQSYIPAASGIRMETRVDEVELDSKRTIPLGIILNELVTNAVKYAFPAGRVSGDAPDIIRVELGLIEDDVLLTVSDNGAGFTGASLENSGLGLELIRMLTRQLGGTFAISGDSGCTATVRFRL